MKQACGRVIDLTPLASRRMASKTSCHLTCCAACAERGGESSRHYAEWPRTQKVRYCSPLQHLLHYRQSCRHALEVSKRSRHALEVEVSKRSSRTAPLAPYCMLTCLYACQCLCTCLCHAPMARMCPSMPPNSLAKMRPSMPAKSFQLFPAKSLRGLQKGESPPGTGGVVARAGRLRKTCEHTRCASFVCFC